MTLNEIAVVAGAGFTGTVASGVAGGVVGDIYGIQAGAAFGSAVGSVIPGFGTFGGALIGGALGMKYGGLPVVWPAHIYSVDSRIRGGRFFHRI